MENKYIMLIRHFESYYDSYNHEKIKYKDSFYKSIIFAEYIKKIIKEFPEIKKIKFYTSDHEITIMTALVISSTLKSELIKNNLPKIEIYDPVIDNIVDRDPKKIKAKYTCKSFHNLIEKKLKHDTLYIYITHSSIISNLFSCILDYLSNKKNENFHKKIYNYSFSYIIRFNDKVSWVYNKKID
jgi:hypothetical protein